MVRTEGRVEEDCGENVTGGCQGWPVLWVSMQWWPTVGTAWACLKQMLTDEACHLWRIGHKQFPQTISPKWCYINRADVGGISLTFVCPVVVLTRTCCGLKHENACICNSLLANYSYPKGSIVPTSFINKRHTWTPRRCNNTKPRII